MLRKLLVSIAAVLLFAASTASAKGGGGGGGAATTPPPAPSACQIVPAELGTGSVGTLNTWFVTTTGCRTSNKPVQFSVAAGRLPGGLTLFTQGVSSGGITGRPTTVGTFAFTLRVRDQTGATDTESFTITIT